MSEELENFFEKMLNTVDKISVGADKIEKIRILMWFVELSFRYNTSVEKVIERYKEAITKLRKL